MVIKTHNLHKKQNSNLLSLSTCVYYSTIISNWDNFLSRSLFFYVPVMLQNYFYLDRCRGRKGIPIYLKCMFVRNTRMDLYWLIWKPTHTTTSIVAVENTDIFSIVTYSEHTYHFAAIPHTGYIALITCLWP